MEFVIFPSDIVCVCVCAFYAEHMTVGGVLHWVENNRGICACECVSLFSPIRAPLPLRSNLHIAHAYTCVHNIDSEPDWVSLFTR